MSTPLARTTEVSEEIFSFTFPKYVPGKPSESSLKVTMFDCFDTVSKILTSFSATNLNGVLFVSPACVLVFTS